MGFLLFTLLPFLFLAIWISLAQLVNVYLPSVHHKRVGILIAHPDDEAMFFSPTVIALTNPVLKNHVKILCLCRGDVPHLGETRKNELLKSATILGLRSSDDVTVLEDGRFVDGMTLQWEPDDVASALSQTFASPAIRTISSEPGSDTSSSSNINIDVLITFDHKGVSSHANHISLYYGALHWLRQIDQTGATVTLYTLTTTNIMRKYISILDSPFSVFSNLFRELRSQSLHNLPEHLLFHNNVTGHRRAQNAMTNGHISQMLWFRWGWIWLSRYIWVNDLKRQHYQRSATELAWDAQSLIKNRDHGST